MRTSRDQPRKGDKGDSSIPSNQGGVTSRGTTISQALRGISSRLGLSELAKMRADQADSRARFAAKAAGQTDAQAARAGRGARAEAHKRTAAAAGVTPATARRWATGAQKPKPATEKTVRPKLQRAVGGAKHVQATQVARSSRVNVGVVTVKIYGKKETRAIGAQNLGMAATAAVADLILAGDGPGAAARLQDAILEAYGDGLTDFMDITDLPDGITWS